jgi:hypothetical protein
MAKDILSAIGNMNEEGVLADVPKEKIRKFIPLLLETSQKIPPRLDFKNCLLAGNFFQRALVK